MRFPVLLGGLFSPAERKEPMACEVVHGVKGVGLWDEVSPCIVYRMITSPL